MTFKGKYAQGYQVVKSDNLRQYLWDLTHKPYTNKIVIIDECDSEFPARMFSDKEQTEIALRLWHTAKLHNYIFLSSHLGNSVDIIMHLATHYYMFPNSPSFETNTMEFSIASRLDYNSSDWVANDIIKTMLIYNRRELTEDTLSEQEKIRPLQRKKRDNGKIVIGEQDLDIEAELEKGLTLF